MATCSKRHRLFRLNSGRCPIHGTGMPQVGGSEIHQGELLTLVGCPRRDCEILAHAKSYDGPWLIHPDFDAVISEAPEGSGPDRRLDVDKMKGVPYNERRARVLPLKRGC